MQSGFDVVVVGSLNHDVTVLAERFPRPGETVFGTSHFTGPGGKGANQAVAAARLGARVAMVGRVGADEHGDRLVENLVDNGVDVSAVDVDAEAPTGLALITVDPTGENTIVGVSGANSKMLPEHLATHRELIASAGVVIAQLEVPVGTVSAAAELTTGTFCLNPAPADRLPEALLADLDVLIPNRGELAMLAGVDEPGSIAEVAEAARRLGVSGAVVVTLGVDGALLIAGGGESRHQAPQVQAVDATGAGDAFCGALAFCLSRGWAMDDAVAFGVAAGAVAVEKHGAQEALPTLDQVEALRAR